MTERRTRVAAVGLALCLALSVGTARGQVNECNSLTAFWTAPGDDGETGQ